MPMSIGQCTSEPPSGAAGRAFAALRDNPASGLAPDAFTEGTSSRRVLAALLEAACRGVIEELVANGTLTLGAGGLQRVPGTLAPTLGPATPVQLTGALT